ncbi:hypothetical protein [Kozakia baliensis]|uniref:hypothetical protein n=1 Tax=Kozakia baliensis TaxID=153496 RepID=UPI0006913F1D|nr:hypothetical protein [Kozakia baliensis]
MPKAMDMTGQKFERLTFIKFLEKRGKNRFWLLSCECGNTVESTVGRVKGGNTKSCGCAQKDAIRKTQKLTVTHNMSTSREYISWKSMIARCYNVNDPFYATYGGRGITVCDKWKKFDGFYACMGERPMGFSLDRINSDGNYEPSNCRWSSNKDQANNRRSNRKIKFEGVERNICEWADFLGVPRVTFRERVNAWGEAEAFRASSLEVRK